MPIIYAQPASSPTRDDVVEEILSNLSGYSQQPDVLVTLQNAIGASDSTFNVDQGQVLSPGTVQVDEELMYATGADSDAGTFTFPVWGRGYRGTTATAHAAGSMVTVAPLMPRAYVIRELNNQILALYPDLFNVKSVQFPFGDLTVDWPIPVDAEYILDVRYQDDNGNWQRSTRWEFEAGMDLASFPTGLALRLTDIPVGQTVQVLYAAGLTALTDPDALFSSCGLDDSCKDLVVMGVLSRMLPALDLGRLQWNSAASQAADSAQPIGTASSLAQRYAANYQARLASEKSVLARLYPARVHFTR